MMTQNGKKEEIKITICQGDENRAKIRHQVDTDDFFYKNFKQAAFIVKKNMDLAKVFYEKKEKIANRMSCNPIIDDNSSEIFSEIPEYSNYITVFTANRGAGKTSTMLSFGKMLENTEFLSCEPFKELITNGGEFQLLSCIDPASMESRDSILKVIISRMFFAFKERFQQYQKFDREGTQNEKKAKLMQHFQKCYKMIDILKQNLKQEDIYDDLYQLSELGDSTNFKVELFR